MELLNSNLFGIQLLLENGGLVLLVILIASVIMWAMIAERYIFVYFTYPRQIKKAVTAKPPPTTAAIVSIIIVLLIHLSHCIKRTLKGCLSY